MAEATDKEILRAAHALRIARQAYDAAAGAEIKARAELSRRYEDLEEARNAEMKARREFDRLLELRPAKDA